LVSIQPENTNGYQRCREPAGVLAEQGALRERVEATVTQVRGGDFTGTALDGGVVATVSGLGALRSVEISIRTKREYDSQTLGEAVTEAVRHAEETARNALAEGVLEAARLGAVADLVDPEKLRRLLGRLGFGSVPPADATHRPAPFGETDG
jgi:DNA-binding protein YbaB